MAYWCKGVGSKEKHSDYLNYLYSLFEPFVGTEPTSTNRKPDKEQVLNTIA